MPQPNQVLPQMAAGFAPLATGLHPTTVTGMEGMPLAGQMGPLGLFAQPLLRSTMGQAGYAPFGMHDVNAYDQIRDLQYSQAQAAAMAQAASHDRDNFVRTFRGMAAMTGTQFGAQQRRAAHSMADTATYVAPMLAQMNPDMLEAMGGLRGSSTVLAQRMMAAGRYRVDPVTGRPGMTAQSAGALASDVYSGLYGDDYRAMHGLTAGQAGSLFHELNMRGMVGSADGDPRARAREVLGQMQRHAPARLQQAFEGQSVQAAGDLGKLSGGDLDKLMLDPAVADRMRGLDAEKVKRSLKAYSSAVSAMRDIFGDMGRPGAPMQELMQGLEALTAGSSAWMDPTRLASVTRQTYNLAKQTGMTMDSAMAVQQHAASRAGQIGLPPVFAVQAAQGGLAFGGAYRASGQAAHTAWGVFNADQMMQADVNLRVQAAGSHMANRLGAVARLAEARGGFAEGSEAASLFSAIRSGQGSFMSGGAARSVVMSDRELFRVLQTGGVSENMARDFIDQAGSNREFIDRFGIGNVIRREQGRSELQPFVRDQLAVALTGSLTGSGLQADVARRAVGEAAGRITKRMFGMSTEAFASTSSRTRELADILGDELRGTAAGAFLDQMAPAQRSEFLRTASSHLYGHTNKALAASPYSGLGGLHNIHRLTNDETLAQADLQQQQAAFTSRMQEAMSPLGRGTPLARAMQFLQDTRPKDDNQLRSMVATAFGGVRTSDVQDALLQPLRELHDRRNELQDLQSKLAQTTDTEERAQLTRQIDKAMDSLGSRAGELARIGETYGYYGDSTVTREDTQRGIGAVRGVADSVQDLGSIRGSFGARATPQELVALRGATGLSHEEAAAVMLARRHADKKWTEVSDKDVADFRAAASHQGTFFTGDDHARRVLLSQRKQQIGLLDPEEVEEARASLRVENDEEARAVAMVRRQSVSPRASEEQVQALRDAGVPDSLARWAADQEQRAKRFGIVGADIDYTIAEHKAGIKQKDGTRLPGQDISRAQAIHALVQGRIMTQYEVTDEDLQAAAGRPDLKGKTPEQVRAILLDERVRDKEQRFKTFFSSDDAVRFREGVDAAGQYSEDIAVKLATPAMTQRLGTQAVEWNKELRAIQRRQQELAYLHTGGDMAKLEAGYFTGIDTRTAEGRKQELSVIGELDKLRQRQMDIFQQLDETHGKAGRQFRTGTIQEGTDALLAAPEKFADTDQRRAVIAKHAKWLAAGRPDAESFAYGDETVNYSRKEFDEVYLPMRRQAQDQVGDREEARLLLGIPKGWTTPEQEQQLERVAYDVSVMRRLPPSAASELAQYRDHDQAMDNLAKRYGVSREELGKAGRGEAEVARLAVSTPAELESHSRASAAYRQARQRQVEAEDRARRLSKQIDSLQGPGNAEARIALQKQLDAAKAEAAGAGRAMNSAIADVGDAALQRGVGPEEYLLDRVGLVTQAERDHIGTSVREFDERKDRADTVARSHGLQSADDARGHAGLAAQYEARRKAAAASDTVSGMDMVKRLNQVYGLGLDPSTMAADSGVQRTASLLASADGRRLIAGLADSQSFLRESAGKRKESVAQRLEQLQAEGKGDSEEAKRLRGYAEKLGRGGNAGVDAMLGAYSEAQRKTGADRDKALAGFRSDFGFGAGDEGDLAFRGFSQAADMQLRTQFSRLGEGRGLGSGSLFDLINNVKMGGDDKKGARSPERIEVSGTLRMVDERTVEINASTGGSMYNV